MGPRKATGQDLTSRLDPCLAIRSTADIRADLEPTIESKWRPDRNKMPLYSQGQADVFYRTTWEKDAGLYCLSNQSQIGPGT
jgi:hypothetical protein